jgi:hypothetical protein
MLPRDRPGLALVPPDLALDRTKVIEHGLDLDHQQRS